MSRRESGYERKERDFNERPSWVTGVLIPHLRRVLRGNVLSTSQNLRRGWTTDPRPLSFGPTPLLANAKTTSDQRSNEKWRTHRPLNRLAMSLMLRRIADASSIYPQIHPRLRSTAHDRNLDGEKVRRFPERFQTFYARQDWINVEGPMASDLASNRPAREAGPLQGRSRSRPQRRSGKDTSARLNRTDIAAGANP